MNHRFSRDSRPPVATAPTLAHIPFNRASVAGQELEYMRRAIEAPHLSADGTFTRQCQRALEQVLGAPKAC